MNYCCQRDNSLHTLPLSTDVARAIQALYLAGGTIAAIRSHRCCGEGRKDDVALGPRIRDQGAS